MQPREIEKAKIETKDHLGNPLIPHECFIEPLLVIEEAVAKINA